MTLYITAGEMMNAQMAAPGRVCVPFNEALLTGTAREPLFSDAFIRERCRALDVAEEEYRTKITSFLRAAAQIRSYDSVVLRFGDEPFCRINLLAALAYLEETGYDDAVIVETVDEQADVLLDRIELRCTGFAAAWHALTHGEAVDPDGLHMQAAAEAYLQLKS